MEKLFRTKYVNMRPKELDKEAVYEPIKLDNKSFNIPDGSEKMLDYLNYAGTITKGSLAADGIIKLYPNSYDIYKRDYGAVANPIKHNIQTTAPSQEDNDNLDNEWSNIFINHNKSIQENNDDNINFFSQLCSD